MPSTRKMIKSIFILYVFIAVVCARSFNQDDAATVKEWEFSAEEKAELKKNLECCQRVLGPIKYDQIKFDVTPEAVYAMPDEFIVKGCPKNCTNTKKITLEVQSKLFWPILYQVAGECPSFDDILDKWDMKMLEALFQVENYCYKKYSDKYVPIARVVEDHFIEVNKKVADLLKRADKEELKKFCKGLIIKGPSMNEEDEEKQWKKMSAFEKECGVPGMFSGKED